MKKTVTVISHENEKQQLETVSRYLNDGHQLLNCGRTQAGVNNVEKAGVLLDALLAMQDAKRRKPSES
ncbi:hypothetical protein HW114_09040 [Serratia symbiotica]|uniref:hypothetical protein n=1 Tax=Serratia symbiotica TaxID=138074 RepID=UPI0018880DA1|nr:hypothetical protein [Serratia symbiotica]MBF1995628.1 hypothetical protein [Serratia symbiotica]